MSQLEGENIPSKASRKRRKERRIEKLRSQQEAYRKQVREKWGLEKKLDDEYDEQQRQWDASDSDFKSEIRNIAEQNRAYYEAIQEQRQAVAARQHELAQNEQVNYRLYYYMPKLNEHPCPTAKESKGLQFTRNVDSIDSGYISNTIIGALTPYSTEMGIDAFITKDDFIHVFETKFFSELSASDLERIFLSYSKNNLFPLSRVRPIIETIFSTPTKYSYIYSCFSRLVSTEAFLKWKVTTSAKERKSGYPGPDNVTLKGVQIISRDEQAGPRDSRPHPRRALLGKCVLLLRGDEDLFASKHTITLAEFAASLGKSHSLVTVFTGALFDAYFTELWEIQSCDNTAPKASL
eukprot:TRINITY_DN24523_c0_g1_i1.p1 TRINITY_DN24523_c0_g1~~TRINITY_DN24523_c0_g1_i1.p1  ORF type:complete len:350 (+),score=57.47 TRINITY_DN24523_c0_g1_i1:102-1151(+)